jgi:hypothetical protein
MEQQSGRRPETAARSDLEVAFSRPFDWARVAHRRLFEFLEFLADFFQPPAKLMRLNPDAGLATDANDMALGVFLETADRYRVHVAATGTENIDGLIFKCGHLESLAALAVRTSETP